MTVFNNLKELKAFCDNPANSLEDVVIGKTITSLKGLFRLSSRTNEEFKGIEKWDVSKVTDMKGMFAFSMFNRDISGWDVSRVSDMSSIFMDCESFNQPIGSWDVSHVTDMSLMFYGCKSFNGDLSQWDVSQVEDMNSMFLSAKTFNQPLEKWDISKVNDMKWMFKGASSFCQPLNKWNFTQDKKSLFMFLNSGMLPEYYPWAENEKTTDKSQDAFDREGYKAYRRCEDQLKKLFASAPKK
ncbi:MAG: DUF285 domain-containing protein [Succinivibrio sp.]|nr:DUF285 domain-containing protein [Succinivibrio sp.]